MTPTRYRSHPKLAVLSFVALALSCLAVPGLVPFGPWEAGLVGVSGALFVVGVMCVLVRPPRRARLDRKLEAMAIVYAVFFLLTGFLGLAVGNQADDVLRSVAPYVGFVVVLAPWWWLGARLTPETLNTQLAIVGAGQAALTFFVFGANTVSLESSALLASRVTQFDPRLTMPFTVAAAVIGFVRAAFAPMFSARQGLYLALALFTSAACFATQTRSQVLSVVLGGLVALLCVVFAGKNARHKISTALRRRLVALMIMSAASGVLLLIFTEFGAALLDVLLARNTAVGDGRIDYEIIPALNLYLESGLGAWLVGVGAGTPFIDSTFESRTYLHNLVLYALLYGGVVGVFAVLGLWRFLAIRLNAAWREQGDVEWLALLAVMAAMFCYAQFFAVHKILPFNLILWLAITSVLTRLRPERVLRPTPAWAVRPQASAARRGVAIAQDVRPNRAR